MYVPSNDLLVCVSLGSPIYDDHDVCRRAHITIGALGSAYSLPRYIYIYIAN